MGSGYCEIQRKWVQSTISQAKLALRVARKIAPPACMKYIPKLKEKIQIAECGLNHCTLIKNCADERVCIWRENNYGYDLALEIDTLVLHICKKQGKIN